VTDRSESDPPSKRAVQLDVKAWAVIIGAAVSIGIAHAQLIAVREEQAETRQRVEAIVPRVVALEGDARQAKELAGKVEAMNILLTKIDHTLVALCIATPNARCQ
jgi:hypothetical protein